MMTCDTMVGLVHEMYEVANTISKAEKALDNYENGGLSMSGNAAELLEKQVAAMKTYHDIVAARIIDQTREATYGTELYRLRNGDAGRVHRNPR